jgi:hypothetical protein
MGPGYQRPLVTESVSTDFDRLIRTEIDGARPSSSSRRGLDETLSLAAGDGRARLTEGRRSLLRVRSLQKEVLEGGA